MGKIPHWAWGKSSANMGSVKIGNWFEKENFGLLFFRIFFGICLIVYGIRSFLNPIVLKHLGKSATAIGLPCSAIFWGTVAAFLLITTGIFILLGFYFRCAIATLLIMGLIGSWGTLSLNFFCFPYPPSHLLVFIGLPFLFIGPGTFCIKK